MPDEWFWDGVDFAFEALADPDAQILAHCHMGINRGPSMAFAERLIRNVYKVLLTRGMHGVAIHSVDPPTNARLGR